MHRSAVNSSLLTVGAYLRQLAKHAGATNGPVVNAARVAVREP